MVAAVFLHGKTRATRVVHSRAGAQPSTPRPRDGRSGLPAGCRSEGGRRRTPRCARDPRCRRCPPALRPALSPGRFATRWRGVGPRHRCDGRLRVREDGLHPGDELVAFAHAIEDPTAPGKVEPPTVSGPRAVLSTNIRRGVPQHGNRRCTPLPPKDTESQTGPAGKANRRAVTTQNSWGTKVCSCMGGLTYRSSRISGSSTGAGARSSKSNWVSR